MDDRVRGGLRPAANRHHLTTSHPANEDLEHHRQQGRQPRPARHQKPRSEFSDADQSRQTGGSRLRRACRDPSCGTGGDLDKLAHREGTRARHILDTDNPAGRACRDPDSGALAGISTSSIIGKSAEAHASLGTNNGAGRACRDPGSGELAGISTSSISVECGGRACRDPLRGELAGISTSSISVGSGGRACRDLEQASARRF
ncbi:hypothetical protein H4V99_000180 [Cryobacterium sp. CG_9.6]|nr:hypothetical protein [Cryobacterium sp. CG_9.6]